MSDNTPNPKSLGNRVGSVQCENTTLHLLKANDFVAKAIRDRLKDVCVINVCSSPGSGKTTLMQETGKRLSKDLNIAVLVGDPETERDAVRMRDVGINALQIVTGGMCHIEAQMILQALDHIDIEGIDLLFIENVGNLLCPSAFDLGEDYRVTLLATTEGDDKPKKYPRMFLTSELMLVSKADLLPYVPFSVDAVTKDAREVNPNLEVITISTLNGDGLDTWCDWLKERVQAKKDQYKALEVK
ncbi:MULTISPECIES: hydrogenase nickel incorporation protein HypB [Sphingobacterium]|jgi:hydrogenase nickel incorporation protein HypB|uniref:Hydrogenase nickel incorporation protein HypB n=2 Tax=Sphingobacterium TaxID=28453 RepID=A0ABX7CX60_SPHMU|nr:MULTISPECIES: hydrogenase nickel incorporation protein HypB [Sphingobacterium]APU98335.1 hydrogenase accessory protein HypB [Sphingobacterium sp. B29]QQT29152.1 hydrogenase nickel incorporation protein HypB [Sphingobacterium multivorum]QQT46725.1 hydrogenase nickel incorporation protein HypB [Sphingobacterium multivorum]QQT54817.1 hydrogenase nickel incorporation protein HypB [Sphingobacterium multivorum]QRY60037.1 hydrogenase nickel incorporation protein HypB [Sphingobacterium siyangense]